MTESSDERTKRSFCNALLNYYWEEKFSIFYAESDGGSNAIQHAADVRKELARTFRQHGFLWRLRLLNTNSLYLDDLGGTGGYVLMPLHTFFVSKKLDYWKCEAVVERVIPVNTRLRVCQITRADLEGYAKSVKKQAPHNLNEFFGKDKINRFSRRNTDAFIPWKTTQSDQADELPFATPSTPFEEQDER